MNVPAAPAEFVQDCKSFEISFEKVKDKVDHIIEKWKKKGYSMQTIGKWLRPQLRKYYSPSGVTKLLPQEAKQKQVHKPKPKKVEQSQTFDEEDDAPYGYYQMSPSKYSIKDVEQYDRLYLINVVKYLHNELAELSEEIATMKKEVTVLEAKH